jgi:hypothetical protein
MPSNGLEFQIVELLLILLSAAFTAWAAIVGWGVAQILKRIDALAAAVTKLDDVLSDWVTRTEGRLSRLEKWEELANNSSFTSPRGPPIGPL